MIHVSVNPANLAGQTLRLDYRPKTLRVVCLARRKVALGEAVQVLSEANAEVALTQADDVLRAAERLGEPSLLSEALLQDGRHLLLFARNDYTVLVLAIGERAALQVRF